MNVPDYLADRLHTAAVEAELRNTERRNAVLARPELAARLTQPPLNYARADQWTGYIPPELWEESPNQEPRRRALLDIVAEAFPSELP